MRLTQKEVDFIERAMAKLQDIRGIGSAKVTKTEVVLILMNLGLKEFDRLYGVAIEPEANLKKKQSKK